MRRRLPLIRLATSRVGRTILERLGVNRRTLENAAGLPALYDRLTSEPDRVASALSGRGWIFHELAHFEAYSTAADFAEQGDYAAADRVLVEAHQADRYALIRFYQRVTSLYQDSERSIEIGLARLRILDEAYALHQQGHYEAVVSLVLSQIDGIFMDMTGKEARTFFNSKNPKLLDEITLGGHPLGLKTLSEILGDTQTTTIVGDRLNRNGILHGRILGYGTLVSATKTWAALLAVIEAMRPHAETRTAPATSRGG